jgi:hypothetical protein
MVDAKIQYVSRIPLVVERLLTWYREMLSKPRSELTYVHLPHL